MEQLWNIAIEIVDIYLLKLVISDGYLKNYQRDIGNDVGMDVWKATIISGWEIGSETSPSDCVTISIC